MKNRKVSLYIAAFLTFITFTGHTIGHFTMPAADDAPAQEALRVMAATPITMPIGPAKSLRALHDGSNLSLSVYLLLASLVLVALARNPVSSLSMSVQISLSGSLLAIAALSFAFFFPVPAVCTGVAGLLGLRSARA